MAWVTPKTDWADTDYFTYADINRIDGNLNVLYPSADLKTDFDNDDIITVTQWQAVLDTLDTIIETTGYSIDAEDTSPSMTAAAYNFNIVESLTQSLSDWIDLLNRQASARIYSGDDLYSSARPENYSRD